jgi:acyl carrier protein
MGMDGVELVVTFEETFGVRIPDKEAEKMVTPRHVIDWLVEQQSKGLFFSEPEPLPINTWWRELRGWRPLKSSRLEERNYTRDEIASEVRDIIRDQLAVDEFSEDDRFVEDLGMG